MPEYLAPAVYVEEVDTGNKPIEGVSTSTAGLIGVTERGPVDVPVLITSFGEFQRWFGGYLNPDDFQNAGTLHCHLPHAVEGFFTNGGRRLYVTRILPEEADPAAMTLFDRGQAVSLETVLLRAAAAGTGDAANPPMILLLDGGGLGAGEWLRVGDGSRAEYHQVASVGSVEPTDVALGAPLAASHDAGAEILEYDGAIVEAPVASPWNFTVVGATAAGSTVITLQAGAATHPEVLNEINTNGNAQLLRLVSTVTVGSEEFRLTSGTVTDVGSDRVEVTLAEALEVDYNAGDTVEVWQAVVSAVLQGAANAGARIVFLESRAAAGDFRTAGNRVTVDRNETNSEVTRIGRHGELELTVGAYEDYRAGARVENSPLNRTVAGGSTATDVNVDDATAFREGEEIEIGTDPATIDSISGSTLTLETALPAAPGMGVEVQSPARSLTDDLEAGDVLIPLNNRVGLEEDDMLRIGTSPDEEYIRIISLRQPRSGVSPDAGVAVASAPLRRAHADGDEVRRVHPPASTADQPAAGRLIFDVEEGADRIYYIDDGQAFQNDDVIRVTLANGDTQFHRLSADRSDLAPVEVELDTSLEGNHRAGSEVAERAALIHVEALDAGGWGNRLRISVEDGDATRIVTNARLIERDGDRQVRLSSPSGVEAGSVLEILDSDNGDPVGEPLKVQSVGASPDYVIQLQDPLDSAQITAIDDALAGGGAVRVRSREFRLTAHLLRQPDPAVPARNETVLDSESFNQLSMDPRHSRYFVTVLGDVDGELRLEDRRPEGASRYIRVDDLAADDSEAESVRLGPEALTDTLPSGRRRAARHALGGGDDSMVTIAPAVYLGEDADQPEDRTGLFSLQNVEEISLVACPGQTGSDIQQALIDHCETMRYRFAVLDGPPPPSDSITDVRAQREQFDTKYAALYHPWLLAPDPFPVNPAEIPDYPLPPAGHVLGVYARTDVERGVHKAPANEVVRGIRGLRRQLNKREHDILNPSPVNINVIRDFRRDNRGIRVYGGRVITSDSDWKYVNVRRLLIFIEHSIDRGLQWVVFEPNHEPLWARVRRAISSFLTVVWRNGALEGATAEEAYFVRCDRTTMTQQDIDNGRLICLVGVAPVKPAEFVIIRIGLWTAHAEE